MTDPINTIRISSESLADGCCANCFKPIVRMYPVGNYLHKHNNSADCLKTPDSQLYVKENTSHSGDTDKIVLYKTVKNLRNLILAHNRLVNMVEMLQKHPDNVISYDEAHVFDETAMTKLVSRFVDRAEHKPNPYDQVKTIEDTRTKLAENNAKNYPREVMTVMGKEVDAPEEIKDTLKRLVTNPELLYSDCVALLTQFGHVCRCVAPMPVKITGKGKIEMCRSCNRVIVDDSRD